jgi:RNA polymerase sigma factor (sigma-70 family)
MPSKGHNSGVATGDEALGGELNRALRRPLMAIDEERRLARRAADGDLGARDRLVEGHVRLVVAIARAHRGRGVPHADLVQEGMMGLLRAVERFDLRRGHRLATYATWWIRRAMLHAIAAAPAIRLPAEGNRELAAILRTEGELTSRGRPRPDSETLSLRTGVFVRRVERLRGAPLVVASLDEQVAGSETPLVELMADSHAPEVASDL